MTEAWRPRRTALERLDRASRSAYPGIQGRIASAMPVRPSRETGHTESVDLEDEPSESGDVYFTQDRFVVTGGEKGFRLTEIPLEHSGHLYWEGVYQPESEWSMDGEKNFTLLDPGNVVANGDEIVMEYAYRASVVDPVLPLFIGSSVAGDNPTHSLAIPAGAQKGDLFIVATTDSSGGPINCTDSRVVKKLEVKNYGKVFWGFLTSSTAPIVVTVQDTSLDWAGSVLIVLRSGVTISGWDYSVGSGSAQLCKQIYNSEAVVVAVMSTNGTVAGTKNYENGSSNYKMLQNRSDTKAQTTQFLWAPGDGSRGNPERLFQPDGTVSNVLVITMNLVRK